MAPDREARFAESMKLDDPGPLKDAQDEEGPQRKGGSEGEVLADSDGRNRGREEGSRRSIRNMRMPWLT